MTAPQTGPSLLQGVRILLDLKKYDLLRVSERLAERYGKFVHVRFFHKHMFFVSDPKVIAAILHDESGAYDKIDTRKTIHHIAGNSLNTLRLDQGWAEKQALFEEHTVRSARIDHVTEQKMDALVARWDEHAASGTSVNASIDLLRLSTTISCESFFRQSVDDLDYEELDRHKYYVVKAMLRRQLSLVRLPKVLDPKLRRAFRYRDRLVKRVIAEQLTSPTAQGSYISDLVAKQGIQVADRRAVRLLRGEVLSALYLASDPFDKLLAKSLYYLARHPEEAERIRDEVRGLEGHGGLTIQTATRLTSVRYFLMEVLRLRTPYAIVGREALVAHSLSGQSVPKGSLFAIMPLLLHKDADYWERPTDFDPSRFEDMSLRAADHFIPFSAGHRKCPGQGVAMRQAMYLLARITVAFDIRLLEGYDYRDEFMGVLSSANPFRFRVCPAESRPSRHSGGSADSR